MSAPDSGKPANSTPDPDALAGTTNSLGQASRHDPRPGSDDDVVEAMDEESPQIPRPDPQHSTH